MNDKEILAHAINQIASTELGRQLLGNIPNVTKLNSSDPAVTSKSKVVPKSKKSAEKRRQRSKKQSRVASPSNEVCEILENVHHTPPLNNLPLKDTSKSNLQQTGNKGDWTTDNDS